MCGFKSGIIFKDKVVVAPGENDSHEDLLESLGIEDSYVNATKMFVRVELLPCHGEWWESPKEYPEKWVFSVDQDIIPDWFEEEEAEKRFRVAVCEWWSDHVLVDQKIEKLNSGFYRLKRCGVKTLCGDVRIWCGDSCIDEMSGSSRVIMMCADSYVGKMSDNSYIHEMHDDSHVDKMNGNSHVGKMYGNTCVNAMYGDSHVDKMSRNSIVDGMYGDSYINKMYGNSRVQIMSDNSHVSRMSGNSTIHEMFGNTHVDVMCDNSSIDKMYSNSSVNVMYDDSMAKDFKEYPNIKILVPKDTNIEVTVVNR